MENRVISLRLSSALAARLETSAKNARVAVSVALGWFLSRSLTNFELLRKLEDSPEERERKLDIRIPIMTFESLRSAADQLGISISVYVRTLLYHFYVTRRLKYVPSDGHYTLAERHD